MTTEQMLEVLAKDWWIDIVNGTQWRLGLLAKRWPERGRSVYFGSSIARAVQRAYDGGVPDAKE